MTLSQRDCREQHRRAPCLGRPGREGTSGVQRLRSGAIGALRGEAGARRFGRPWSSWRHAWPRRRTSRQSSAPPGTWTTLTRSDGGSYSSGYGPDKHRLLAEACDLTERGVITFVEPGREALPAIREADIGVLMTDERVHTEGCSNTLMEYMACGLPVVCTRGGGNPELVLDGETGYLIDAGSSGRLVERLRRLASDPGLAQRMGLAGRRRLIERFSTERMMTDLLDVYREVAPLMTCLSRLSTRLPEARRSGMSESLTSSTIHGMKWSYASTLVTVGLQIGVTALLARLLPPERLRPCGDGQRPLVLRTAVRRYGRRPGNHSEAGPQRARHPHRVHVVPARGCGLLRPLRGPGPTRRRPLPRYTRAW